MNKKEIVKTNNYWFRHHSTLPTRLVKSIEFTKYVWAVAIDRKEETPNRIQGGTYCALFTFRVKRERRMHNSTTSVCKRIRNELSHSRYQNWVTKATARARAKTIKRASEQANEGQSSQLQVCRAAMRWAHTMLLCMMRSSRYSVYHR